MIDPVGDELLTLEEAAGLKCLRTCRGRKPHKNTLKRWWRDGVRGVFLETTATPDGARYTTREAVREFLARLNAGTQVAVAAAMCPDARRAESECDRIFGA